jgi:hypothetical protein
MSIPLGTFNFKWKQAGVSQITISGIPAPSEVSEIILGAS